ncbi:MAG: Holliday junction resolvase RuvX [Ruminococcaceae bacterium]|nr:Holliday junction resolvase RuvX [Oscillospiraceae bacterium]
MIIMSVDLGKARTGIAVSDPSGQFAFPKDVITEYNTDRLVDKVCEKAKEYTAERIVVGYPKNMDGTLGERAQECANIAEQIKVTSGLETVLWDERCTTVTAHNYLSMNNVRGKKRKQTVDAVAAVIILEDYLRSL